MKKSSVPLKIIFSPENIIIEIDNEMHIYDYASLRKFSKTPDGKYAQLWFKDINDIYNDFVYDIEYTQELDLIIKGICVFGSHFIDIDDFNAWHRKDFKELYQ